MKNIIRLSFCILGLSFMISCETDRDPVPSANGFELRATKLFSNVVLSPAINNDTIADLRWDPSDHGFSAVSSYKIEIAASGTNFANLATGNSGNFVTIAPDSLRYVLKVGELNALINQLPEYQCGQPISIDVRIKSVLGATQPNSFTQYSSNVITFTTTPYSNDLAVLAFATSASNLDNELKLRSSSNISLSDYEAFAYLEPGTYKFYRPNSCNEFLAPVVYGISGSSSGSLILDGSNGFVVTTAGHYFITANLNESGTNALTYGIRVFNVGSGGFGIFGTATRPLGFANTTPMTYDAATKKWTVTMELIDGKKFSFKTNNGTAVATLTGTGNGSFTESPLTTATGASGDGSIKAPGDFVDNNTKTRYTIEVDLSKPRNYTYKLTLAP